MERNWEHRYGRGKEHKLKQAIALEYNPEEDAPKVIASGKGVLAEKIIEKAKESDVPIHRDDKLANTLSKLEIGDMIPPELYEVMAEILVFVDSMDKLRGKLSHEKAPKNAKKKSSNR